MENLNYLQVLKFAFYHPDANNVLTAVDVLYKITGKKISKSVICDNVFRIEKSSQPANEFYIRVSIQSCAAYLQYLANNPNDCFDLNVKTAIADIAPFLRANKEIVDLDFIVRSSKYIGAAIFHHQIVGLFYENRIKDDYKSRYNLDHMVLFGLRSALELRIKGILGIDVIETERGHNIGLAGLIDYLLQLKTIQFAEQIN